jgi:hypothetical protein
LTALVALGIFLLVILLCADGRALMAPYLEATRLINVVIVLAAYSLLLYLFGIGKSLINQVTPYVWDAFFAALDRRLCFGFFPHDLLHTALPRPWFLWWIDRIYLGWFNVCYFVLTVVAFRHADSFARQHFLVAFALIWIVLGNLFATIFASAGPIFYDVFQQPIIESYTQAAQFMRDHHSLAIPISDVLLVFVRNDSAVDFNGPSAFPSMHVAASAVIFFYYQRYGLRWQKVAAGVFLALIMVGSVYLLWHYAVDAYFALIGAYLIWKGSEYLLHKFQPELT